MNVLSGKPSVIIFNSHTEIRMAHFLSTSLVTAAITSSFLLGLRKEVGG